MENKKYIIKIYNKLTETYLKDTHAVELKLSNNITLEFVDLKIEIDNITTNHYVTGRLSTSVFKTDKIYKNEKLNFLEVHIKDVEYDTPML